MDKDRQLFTHELVDDDIDELINKSYSLSSDPDIQFISELRQVYKEDTDSLNRVWKRLERYNQQQRIIHEPISQTAQRGAVGLHAVPFERGNRNRRSTNKRRYPVNQVFTVLAAAIIGVFVVSSLTWILAMTHSAGPGAARRNPDNSIELTVHNDTSGQTNYFTLTYVGDDGVTKDHVACQAIPPLDWVNVESSPGVPTQIPMGQILWLRYFHSSTCNPSSQFMSVSLPIPQVPVYNHCWFNPDNTTTPNWSGCVNPSQILPISWS